jgi:hypothetical protein
MFNGGLTSQRLSPIQEGEEDTVSSTAVTVRACNLSSVGDVASSESSSLPAHAAGAVAEHTRLRLQTDHSSSGGAIQQPPVFLSSDPHILRGELKTHGFDALVRAAIIEGQPVRCTGRSAFHQSSADVVTHKRVQSAEGLFVQRPQSLHRRTISIDAATMAGYAARAHAPESGHLRTHSLDSGMDNIMGSGPRGEDGFQKAAQGFDQKLMKTLNFTKWNASD